MFCICESNLHYGQEEIGTNPFDRTLSVSAQFFQFRNILRMSGESLPIHKASRLRSRPVWTTPEGIFSSVEDILLLIHFCALDCFPVASPNFNWLYILFQNVLINLGIQFSIDGSKLSKPWGNKTSPNHDGLSSILLQQRWGFDIGVLCTVPFSPLITFCVCFSQTTQLWFNLSKVYFCQQHPGALFWSSDVQHLCSHLCRAPTPRNSNTSVELSPFIDNNLSHHGLMNMKSLRDTSVTLF